MGGLRRFPAGRPYFVQGLRIVRVEINIS